jgi:hypothetical protein
MKPFSFAIFRVPDTICGSQKIHFFEGKKITFSQKKLNKKQAVLARFSSSFSGGDNERLTKVQHVLRPHTLVAQGLMQ